MLIRRADEMPGQPVDMDGVKDVSMRLMVGRSDGAPNFALRHFTVAPGGHTPRHAHNYEHEVYVVAGAGRAESDGTLHDIRAGDVLLVEPNSTHQFTAVGDRPLEFLCLVPLEHDCGGGAVAPTPGS
ncbi:MAG: cupin domain-containing protein [Phycisphaerales bacterium]|nr:cupin domain-containing protein [Phycisphaerae bacterium]NNF41490.1 cupin domain-containing protein [Phycisphaerales bacterium]NNM27358.1 cupin domain-containing protein [Phycisphaerales bacterium]